jgi:rhomboid-like protein
MSNAWVTVASKALCTAPRRSQPLLQLFRAFHHSSHAFARGQEKSKAIRNSQAICNIRTTTLLRQRSPYATSADKPNRKSTTADDSKLQPATTSASYTEGVVETASSDDAAVTWRDYDPEGGMPLPDGERSQAEIDAIFGSEGMDVDTGNYILSVMQWRRLSGALIDVGLDFPIARQISRSHALKGLEYLRSLDSAFDEQAAGSVWAEEETERLRDELRERAVSLKLYKADPVEEEESDQGTEYGRAKTGGSALQQMQAYNEAKWEREEAARLLKEQQEQTAAVHSSRGPLQLSGGVQPVVALTNTDAHGDVSITGAQTKGWLKPVERKEWVKYYEDQATIIKDNVVPNLSALQRLGPATILALFTLTGLVILSDQYTPPSMSARIFPDYPPAVSTLGAITAITLTTFIFSRLPFFWRANSKFFCIVPAYPYAVSLLGAAWRHDTVSHLAANLATLWLFGLSLHEDVGRGTFLAIFLGAGAFGGWVSLVRNVATKQWMTYSFGSSGGVLGVAAAACVLRPNGAVSVWGVEVPLVAWMLVGLYTAGELFGMLRLRRKTTTDHAGHLGGLLAGVAAAYHVKQQQPAAVVAGDDVMKHTPALQTVDV